MEFINRSGQTAGAPVPNTSHQPAPSPAKRRMRDRALNNKFSIFMLVLIGLIVALTAAYIATTRVRSEGSFVDGSRFQAVFLNGGQVYFGKIKDLNSKYITMDNIYYLQANQTTDEDGEVTAVNPTLSKLGCELHAPEDKMVINRDQVQFWENLKDEKQSKVVYAIQEYVKQYPNGETCQDPAQAASGNNNNGQQQQQQQNPAGGTQPTQQNNGQ